MYIYYIIQLLLLHIYILYIADVFSYKLLMITKINVREQVLKKIF